MKGLNSDIQVLSIHMTSTRKIFNKVDNYVKRVEGSKKVGQAKFGSSYSKAHSY